MKLTPAAHARRALGCGALIALLPLSAAALEIAKAPPAPAGVATTSVATTSVATTSVATPGLARLEPVSAEATNMGMTNAGAPAASPSGAGAGPTLALAPSLASGLGPSASPASSTTSGSNSSTANLLQVIFGLTFVLALLALVAWVLKRVAGARLAGGQNIRIIGGVSVGNRERVMVVEVADQWIVLGVAPGQVNALASMPRQETAAPAAAPASANTTANPAAPGSNFANWLKQSIEKRNAT